MATIKVVKLGNGNADVEVRVGDTVGTIIERIGYPTEGCQVQLNGVGTAMHVPIIAGKIITIAPKIGGGSL